MYIWVLFVFSMTRPGFLPRHFAKHLIFLNEGMEWFVGWKFSTPFLAKQLTWRVEQGADAFRLFAFLGHLDCLDFGGSFWEAITFYLSLLSF
jgi:hypothetical protein